MLYFWLLAAIAIFLVTTFMVMTEGFNKWAYYYIFVVIALLMYVVKKWMMNRMEKHLKYMEEQNQQKKP
jgi:cell division protein FtsW (lipid II flippase)